MKQVLYAGVIVCLFMIVFLVLTAVMIESQIESIKQRINSVEISCSEIPSVNSATFRIPDWNATYYCNLVEKG